MGKSEKTRQRLTSQFAGVDSATLSILQSAYSNKDVNLIRKVLNKPKLKDSSALAQARLASQYVRMVSTPTKSDIRFIKKKYSIDLTSNPIDNVNKMEKIKKKKKIITIVPKPPIISTPISVLSSILNPPRFTFLTKARYHQTLRLNPTRRELAVMLSHLHFSNANIVYLRNRGVNKMRFFAKLRTDQTKKFPFKIVSSIVMDITDLTIAYKFLGDNDVNRKFVGTKGYKYKEKVYATSEVFEITITSVERVWVNFYID